MPFQEQIISTLIGTIAGFIFGLVLFYITTYLEKRHKRKQLIINLIKECECVFRHYLNQIALVKSVMDTEKYKIRKVLPFDTLFRVKQPFLSKCYDEGIIYELLSEEEIFDLNFIESQMMYEDKEIQRNKYSLDGVDKESVLKYHKGIIKTRMDYCGILRKLIKKCRATGAETRGVYTALEIKPDFAQPWFNKGVSLEKISRPEEALEAYNKALEIKPDFAEAWCNKGAVLENIGRPEEALEAYNKALEIKPDFAEVWYNKGTTLGNLSRPEEALEAYDKALEIKPDFAEVWYNKGAVLGNLNRHEEALEAFNKASQIRPDFAEAWCSKAMALGDLNRHEEALEAFNKALEIKPDFAEALLLKDKLLSII